MYSTAVPDYDATATVNATVIVATANADDKYDATADDTSDAATDAVNDDCDNITTYTFATTYTDARTTTAAAYATSEGNCGWSRMKLSCSSNSSNSSSSCSSRCSSSGSSSINCICSRV